MNVTGKNLETLHTCNVSIRRLRQEEHEFQVRLSSIERPCSENISNRGLNVSTCFTAACDAQTVVHTAFPECSDVYTLLFEVPFLFFSLPTLDIFSDDWINFLRN